MVTRHKRVIFLEQIPECRGVLKFYRENFAPVNFLFDTNELHRQVIASCGGPTVKANQFIADLARESGADFLNIASKFQQGHTLPFSGEDYYYKDDIHLNEFGGITMGKFLADKFPELGPDYFGHSSGH